MNLDNLTLENTPALSLLEERIAYHFTSLALLQKALIHRSYRFERWGKEGIEDNERLEFLGDAVLDLIIGHALYEHFPTMLEGELTRLRSALVNEEHLALMAKEIGLGAYILLGRGEGASLGREKPSILSCAYEALIGAIFLDGGYAAVAGLIEKQFVGLFAERQKSLALDDPKSALQELLQERYGEGPGYLLDGVEGPDHQRLFHVSVRFQDAVLGRGSAPSKKKAEQQAAAEALERLSRKTLVDG